MQLWDDLCPPISIVFISLKINIWTWTTHTCLLFYLTIFLIRSFGCFMSISKLTSGVHDCFSQICKFQIFLPSESLSECLRSWLCLLSCVWLFVTPWTVACQALLSMGFSRQEYWSGWIFPPPGDLPDPGMEPTFLESPAFADGLFTTRAIWEVQEWWQNNMISLQMRNSGFTASCWPVQGLFSSNSSSPLAPISRTPLSSTSCAEFKIAIRMWSLTSSPKQIRDCCVLELSINVKCDLVRKVENAKKSIKKNKTHLSSHRHKLQC